MEGKGKGKMSDDAPSGSDLLPWCVRHAAFG